MDCRPAATPGQHLSTPPQETNEALWQASGGSGWMRGASARSSCFHNYNMTCSLASKHSTSAGPSTQGRESYRDRCILGPAVSRGRGGAWNL